MFIKSTEQIGIRQPLQSGQVGERNTNIGESCLVKMIVSGMRAIIAASVIVWDY